MDEYNLQTHINGGLLGGMFIVSALNAFSVCKVREIRRAVLLNRALDDDSDTEWENPETIDSRATPRPESTTGMITYSPFSPTRESPNIEEWQKESTSSRFVSVVNEGVLHNLVGQHNCVNVLGPGSMQAL